MLRFGIVSQINPLLVQARVNFGDDDSTSFWLPVLQTKTLKDKFYSMPDIGEQVVCLMDENSEDGVILGAVYSSEDIPVTSSINEMSINLENGSLINIDKETQTLTVAFSHIKLVGDIEHDGAFVNSEGIISKSDISDKKSSLQAMRDIYNQHLHTGNQGNPTSKPQGAM
nr:MAG TPA: baseplate assembly protein [Caudoviricetes sp.]